jgi:type II secretory pathway component PulC
VYQREIFRYPRSGRPDPFRSLLGAVEAGVRAENLLLRGIVYSPDRGASFAVLTEGGSNRAMRLRVGQRLGNVQVVAIYPRRVDLVIQDLGGARRESLVLREAGQQGTP